MMKSHRVPMIAAIVSLFLCQASFFQPADQSGRGNDDFKKKNSTQRGNQWSWGQEKSTSMRYHDTNSLKSKGGFFNKSHIGNRYASSKQKEMAALHNRYHNKSPVAQEAFMPVIIGAYCYFAGFDEKINKSSGGRVGYIQKYDMKGNIVWTRFGFGKTNESTCTEFLALCAVEKTLYGAGSTREGAVALMKQDTSGIQSEMYTFDVSASDDVVVDMIASEGYIYIAGCTSDGTFLLKCTTEGKQEWCSYWNGGYASGVTISGESLFLTGQSSGDMFLLRYSTEGQVQTGSVVFYDGGGNEWGSAITSLGSYLYITGGSFADGASLRTIVFKYSTASVLEAGWPKTYGSYECAGNAIIAVTEKRNSYLYVGGWLEKNEENKSDLMLLKLSLNGTVRPGWPKSFAGEGFEGVRGLVSSGTSLYVAGFQSFKNENDERDCDAFMAKYSTGGSLLWSKTYRGSLMDEALDMASAENTLYLTGYTTNYEKGRRDLLLQSYDAKGNLLWSTQWSDPNDGRSIQGEGVIVYGENIYVVADMYIDYPYVSKTYLLRFDFDGNYVAHTVPYTDECNEGHGIAVFDDKIYICGRWYSALNVFVYDPYFVATTPPEADYHWVTDNPEFETQTGMALIVDESGIFVTGYIQFPMEPHLVVLKLQLYSGRQEWYKTYGSVSCGNSLVRNRDNLYITGEQVSVATGSTGMFLLNLTTDGREMWKQVYSPSMFEWYMGYDILVSGNNLYICGQGGDYNSSIFKYSFSGQLYPGWPAQWGIWDDWSNCMVSLNSNLYTAGRTGFLGLGLCDVLLQKYNPSSPTSVQPAWSKSWGGQE
ncbi:MAG: hypothetical protein JW795_18425 [Chitinivibrionales bacterium]|nr:hypothetical protein [Chitinivibrionales bacterium]